jgi:hypothetical protein
VDNDSFGEDIISKPYLKYEYQAVSKGPKRAEKQAFLKTINRSFPDHSYNLNLLKKEVIVFFCSQKSNLGAQKE